MRYHEILEATKHDRDPDHDRQHRAEAWHKLDTARHKRSQAAQAYMDRARSADADQRKAQQELAETDADQPDYHTEHQSWLRYWAKQKRLDRALSADAEKRSRGLSTHASLCVS